MEPTPGPWRIEDLTIYALNNVGGNRFSANVQGGWLDDEAARTPRAELAQIAHLIAAAPALLAACERIIEEAQRDCIMEEEWSEGERMARAAIAKARGETP